MTEPVQPSDTPRLHIRGARQNNLKNFDLDIHLGEFTVVTGLSGSGKSSLVFDTLYAEGQRRYVETFSPYARQFLDRMNRPQVDAIEGIPPAIAIDQNGSVRTSRSTVGTMTELNDHLKLLFQNESELFCPSCARHIVDFTPESMVNDLNLRLEKAGKTEARLYVTFTLTVPKNLPLETAKDGLSAQGFTRFLKDTPTASGTVLTVVTDRFRADRVESHRLLQAITTALEKGAGTTQIYIENEAGDFLVFAQYREGRVCGECDRAFSAPTASTFSFNSPLGACDTCKGFGKILAPDPALVIPDDSKSLSEDAVKPWSTKAFRAFYEEMLWHAKANGIRTDVPYAELTEAERHWLWAGDPNFSGRWTREWYGIDRFFKKLEEKNYKMHVRVMLSRYRSGFTCPTCLGARLKPEGLWWRYGSMTDTRTRELPGYFYPAGMTISEAAYQALPGYNLHELMGLSIERLHALFSRVQTEAIDEAHALLLREILARLTYLKEVGLGYLTLDRQGRTLSGGEVQRVSLAAALGTSLVNTLFVLDEPSIGLHPRDTDRVNRVIRRLTEAGNTLVVVEHDPQVMLAGQRMIEVGPGAGAAGGSICFDGTTREALDAQTLTADYLTGRKRIERLHRVEVTPTTPAIHVMGAKAHNLKNLHVAFPTGALVVVAGVSGSGKSTLVGDILVPALRPDLKKALEHDAVQAPRFHDVIYVDQSTVGKTSRGNPASYLKVFDPIRRLFAASDDARQLGLQYTDFSFNTGEGRCATCSGTGFEEVSMQFLSDILLPCPDCDGTRYKKTTLQAHVTLKDGKRYNIAEVLDLTVDEAIEAFADYAVIRDSLKVLSDVSLGYIKLGQPLNTLSGGELQRLKLASHLTDVAAAGTRRLRRSLLIFDEPTTGLHFDDIAKLVKVFSRLVELGHSVIVVEHNLDVLNVADWIIELGPEGGENGGELLFTGTPDEITQMTHSPTGVALKAWRQALAGEVSRESFFNLPPLVTPERLEAPTIRVNKAFEHNLKGLSVAIPRERFTVVTGPSGSGKSTLAFDIIFAEGQRRYLESLNAYARSMVQPPPIPDVESVKGIPPTVAIEQRTSRGGLRSTVATMSELWHFLRLLWVKLGTQYCPTCQVPAGSQTPEAIAKTITQRFNGETITLFWPLALRRKGAFRAEMEKLGKEGYSTLRIDGAYVSTRERIPKLDLHSEHTIEVPVGTLRVATDDATQVELARLIDVALTSGLGVMFAGTHNPSEENTSYKGRYDAHKTDITLSLFSTEASCPVCSTSFPEPTTKRFSYNSSAGACPTCTGYGVITEAIRKAQAKDEAFAAELSAGAAAGRKGEALETCPTCSGARLNEVARAILWKDLSIVDVGAMTIRECKAFFEGLTLTDREAQIGKDALVEIQTRLEFLLTVGLDYLQLDRGAPTLSGGEAQRIRLAAQLGSNLKGACYVLDEPTIGLHPRDNAMLLGAIERLTHKGNTLIVVEHDEETIRRADYVLDIGPGAGRRGGELIAQGTFDDLLASPTSLTGECLRTPLVHTGRPETVFNPETDAKVTVHDIRRHNLNIDALDVPLGRLTVVTGVSGSGKSTLTRDVLFENLHRAVAAKKTAPEWVWASRVEGFEPVKRVLEVDQTPIGKTPRSCPATYIGFFDKIRELFAQTTEGQIRGYTASHFSFNTEGGRCPTCNGQGIRTIEMAFLPDVKVECETCHGARFTPEILAVTWKGKSIGDILTMDVDEAVDFFESQPSIAHPLKMLQDVGLGYLTLGQPSPTLSGGEAQRLKLVTELSKVRDVDMGPKVRRSPHTVYVLDEPTVGLHMSDVARLIDVLKRLVAAGNTVIVVEHNLDVMAEADWIIDLGPEGGAGGGRIVATDTPEAMSHKSTPTGEALATFLRIHQ